MALTGWPFWVLSVQVDETPADGEEGASLAGRLARLKAEAAAREANGYDVLLAADTVVESDGAILGKPEDSDQARAMLTSLSGGEHEVITAIQAMRPHGAALQDLCRTRVLMRRYGPEEIEAYLDTGSPLDKAGAYGIQDRDFQPVDLAKMDGCFANVMGLPLCHLLRTMRALGYDASADVPAACQAFTSYSCRVYAGILGSGR